MGAGTKLLWVYEVWAEPSVSCYWGTQVLTHGMPTEAPGWHWVVCAIGMVTLCASPASRILVSDVNYNWGHSFAKYFLSLWVQRIPPQSPLVVDKIHGKEGSLPLPQSCIAQPGALWAPGSHPLQETMKLNRTAVSNQSSGCRGRWRHWHPSVETKVLVDGHSHPWWWQKELCFLGGREPVCQSQRNSNARQRLMRKREMYIITCRLRKSWWFDWFIDKLLHIISVLNVDKIMVFLLVCLKKELWKIDPMARDLLLIYWSGQLDSNIVKRPLEGKQRHE